MLEEDLKIKTFSDYLAFTISSILSPYLTAAIFIIIIVYSYSKSLAEFLPWVLTFFLFAIVIPGIYVLWLFETKQIKNIHISVRENRRKPFLLLAISSIIGATILWVLNAARPVVVIGVVYAANSLVMAVVTQFWKISVHTAMFSSIATITVILFGARFWWLYLLLIPLAWSRIHRKRHTIWQAIVGAVVAFILTALTFWLFGYL